MWLRIVRITPFIKGPGCLFLFALCNQSKVICVDSLPTFCNSMSNGPLWSKKKLSKAFPAVGARMIFFWVLENQDVSIANFVASFLACNGGTMTNHQ
jgi:hypothetical protein